MNSMVLFDRYEITPMKKAKHLAAEIRASFSEGMKDLEQLLKEREEEIENLHDRLERYEPSWRPKKYT